MARKSRKTMNISVTSTMQKYVSGLVESGDYQSASEVFREGLRLVRQRKDSLRDLQHKIDQGIRSIERGETYSAEEVMAEWDRRDALAVRRSTRRRRTA